MGGRLPGSGGALPGHTCPSRLLCATGHRAHRLGAGPVQKPEVGRSHPFRAVCDHGAASPCPAQVPTKYPPHVLGTSLKALSFQMGKLRPRQQSFVTNPSGKFLLHEGLLETRPQRVLRLKGIHLIPDGGGVMPTCRSSPVSPPALPTMPQQLLPQEPLLSGASASLHLVPALCLALSLCQMLLTPTACLQGPPLASPPALPTGKCGPLSECPR